MGADRHLSPVEPVESMEPCDFTKQVGRKQFVCLKHKHPEEVGHYMVAEDRRGSIHV